MSNPSPNQASQLEKISRSEYLNNVKRYLNASKNGKQIEVVDEQGTVRLVLGKGEPIFEIPEDQLDEDFEASWLS